VIKNMSASGRNSVNNVEAYNLDCRELWSDFNMAVGFFLCIEDVMW
jgi:hypothetical protein